MSVVIVGGNECMQRNYLDVCRQFRCKAKIFPKMERNMQNFGTPDLLILFTGTCSHKLVRCALSKIDENRTRVARSHSASLSALRAILGEHFGG